MAVTSKFPAVKQLTPLNYGSARVIYNAADEPQYSKGKTHEFFHPLEDVRKRFKSKSRVDLTETPSQFAAHHHASFRLDLDTAGTKARDRGIADYSTTQRLQGRGRTPSREHLSKAVGTVRSVRIPNITAPCAQVVRNIVKSTRTPGSAGSAKGKEPYFEIVTPTVFDLTFAKREVSDDEDSDATGDDVSLEVVLPSDGESPNVPPELHTLWPEERLPNPHSAKTTPISPRAGYSQDLPWNAPASPSTSVPKLENSSVPAVIETSLPKRLPLPKPPSQPEKPVRKPLVITDPPLKKVTRPLPIPPIVPRLPKSCHTTSKTLPFAPTVDINRGLPPLPSR